MIRRVVPVAIVLAVLIGCPPRSRAEEGAPEPELKRLRTHVATLASPDYQGRRGAGGLKAASYIEDQFRGLKLEPLFGAEFVQEIPARDTPDPMGRNVGAILRGSDPVLRDEWIVVSAHFDHLGTNGVRFYPGADDNASGVAMMLEVARCAVESKTPLRRSLMFIGFDLEEIGLFGSRYFVEHSPVPLSRIALFITADMIGRSLGGVCEPYVFAMGTEHVPEARPWVVSAAKGRPVTVGLLGSDLLILDRSDYGPFRSRKVPYLFFSTGENPSYHTTNDVPETLNYPKVEAISRTINGIARLAAQADRRPEWSASSEPPLAEAETIRDILRQLLAHNDELKIAGIPLMLMKNTLKNLDAIIGRGRMTHDERTGVIRAVRIILLSVF
jgi:Peptidase family M28